MTEIITHDNGSRPFKVVLHDKTYVIYVGTYDEKAHTYDYVDVTQNGAYKHAFVPPEPNSILLQISEHIYMYVGHEIYTFRPKAPIAHYHSPMGNSDVPYPFAVDVKGNGYFMLDRASVPLPESEQKKTDAYPFFYRLMQMTPNRNSFDKDGRIIPEMPIIDSGIYSFFIDKDEFCLTVQHSFREENAQKPHFIQRNLSNTLDSITRHQLKQEIKQFKHRIGYEPFSHLKILHERTI